MAAREESVLEAELARRLGRRLEDRRKDLGLSQEKAAHLAGLSRNHYQLLESGLSDRAKNTPANPRLSTLLHLSRVLGCSVTELLDGMDGAVREA